MHEFINAQITDDIKRTNTRLTIAVLLVALTMLAVPLIIFALIKNLKNAFVSLTGGMLKFLQLLMLILLGVDSSYIGANNPTVMAKVV
jgi:hypothetical protein